MANGDTFQEAPDPKQAFASKSPSGLNTSSIYTMTDNTTVLDVAVISNAGSGGLALRWVQSTDTQGSVIATGASANFDYVIPPNYRQRLVVPIDPSKNGVGTASVVGINVQKGLYQKYAIIGTHAPMPSVFVAEH